jgi:hypothetical protein
MHPREREWRVQWNGSEKERRWHVKTSETLANRRRKRFHLGRYECVVTVKTFSTTRPCALTTAVCPCLSRLCLCVLDKHSTCCFIGARLLGGGMPIRVRLVLLDCITGDRRRTVKATLESMER